MVRKGAILLLVIVLIIGVSLTAYQLRLLDFFLKPALSPEDDANLLLQYRFNSLTGGPGTYISKDSSNKGRNASVTNVVDVPGFRNRALQFNGGGYGIVKGSDIFLDRTFSVEVWVKPKNVTNNSSQIIITDRVEGAAYESMLLQLKADNIPVFSFSYSNNFSERINISGTQALEREEWHHIVGAFDNELLKLYVDGSLVASASTQGKTPYNNPKPFTIGAHNGTASNGGWQRFLNGAIDDLSIYDIALSESDIALKYRSAMQLYYPFETIASSSTPDMSGNGFNASVSGASLVQGVIGNALHLNGSAYANTLNTLNFDNEFSLGMWVKLNKNTSEVNESTQRIIDKSIAGQSWASYSLRVRQDDKVEFVIHPFNNETFISSVSQNALVKEKWYYIASVLRNDNLELYINGILENSAALNGLRPLVSGSPIIGAQAVASGGHTNYLYGDIDELRAYERALTSTELSQFCVPLTSTCLGSGNLLQCNVGGYGFTQTLCANGCSNGACNGGGGGSGGGGGGGGGGSTCVPLWACSWGPCINGEQRNSCVDSRNCRTSFNKPNETVRSCATALQCVDNDQDGYGEGVDCLGIDLDDGNPLITASSQPEENVEVPKEDKLIGAIPYLISALFLILVVFFAYLIIVHIKKKHKEEDEHETLLRLQAVRMIVDAKKRGYTNDILINSFKDKGWSDEEIDDLFKEADRIRRMNNGFS